MIAKGNIEKMSTELKEVVHYHLQLGSDRIYMNDLVGQTIKLNYLHQINCVNCGKITPKSFAQGLCYPCFAKSPENSDCILRPELCRGHLGEGRDVTWELEHHVKPHYVYLAQSSHTKVGVTRSSQVPTRWIDQGASRAIVIAETPNRYLAGCIEVALKSIFSDKTDWRKMLKNEVQLDDLDEQLQLAIESLPMDLQEFAVYDSVATDIHYPLPQFPEKVVSTSFDKQANIEMKLQGIKGQYLIFENGIVTNLRSASGYLVELEF
jgi:hypothetical protein